MSTPHHHQHHNQKKRTQKTSTPRKKFSGGAITEGAVPGGKRIEQHFIAYKWREPNLQRDPPTLLKKSKVAFLYQHGDRDVLSLPAYRGGIDPNPPIFDSLWCFFGMMFADLASWPGPLLGSLPGDHQKYRPKGDGGGKHVSVGTVLGESPLPCSGVLTGGFFGDAVYPVSRRSFRNNVIVPLPALINPLQDPMTIMVIALGLGVASHAVWTVCPYLHGGPGWTPSGWHFGCGPLVDCVCGDCSGCFRGALWWFWWDFWHCCLLRDDIRRVLYGNLLGGLASWYDITSWLGDILSYCRLMALMLATSVISQVFNILATLPGEGLPKPVGILVFLVIFWWEISLTWASTSLGPMFMRPASVSGVFQ